jgi:hypothetical protein
LTKDPPVLQQLLKLYIKALASSTQAQKRCWG